MRRWFLLGFVIVLLAIGMVAYRTIMDSPFLDSAQVTIGGVAVELIGIADNDMERTQGLSNHPGLLPGQGLLFVFDKEGAYSFWMKDMLFSIDIIWIDAKGKVVTIAQGVSPETYPKAFTSDSPAQYVLEVAAGFALTHGISVGDRMEF